MLVSPDILRLKRDRLTTLPSPNSSKIDFGLCGGVVRSENLRLIRLTKLPAPNSSSSGAGGVRWRLVRLTLPSPNSSKIDFGLSGGEIRSENLRLIRLTRLPAPDSSSSGACGVRWRLVRLTRLTTFSALKSNTSVSVLGGGGGVLVRSEILRVVRLIISAATSSATASGDVGFALGDAGGVVGLALGDAGGVLVRSRLLRLTRLFAASFAASKSTTLSV